VKTISLKKVAVVAVASLGFGLLSVVPAQAGVSNADRVTSINLTTVTSSPKVNSRLNALRNSINRIDMMTDCTVLSH
jgi:hypothetical protein